MLGADYFRGRWTVIAAVVVSVAAVLANAAPTEPVTLADLMSE